MTIPSILKSANRFSGLRAINRRMRIRRIASTLERLDNRTLEDIGLSRWQIQDRAQQIVDRNDLRAA